MRHPLLCWDIIMEGMGRREMFAGDMKAIGNLMHANNWDSQASALDSSLIWENKTIVITDVNLKIVLATENMYAMNGYKPAEVVGRHPKMFQGEATTLASRQIIKIAVNNAAPFNCDIINYRKNGQVYTCRIEGYPVFNKLGKLINFIAIENAA
ncbi:MAG: PAS domain-containing protein [Chitinophagaceae bacterium]